MFLVQPIHAYHCNTRLCGFILLRANLVLAARIFD
jgi:hypothetical protein